jgi:hypothetical protein
MHACDLDIVKGKNWLSACEFGNLAHEQCSGPAGEPNYNDTHLHDMCRNITSC